MSTASPIVSSLAVPPLARLDREDCLDLERSTAVEWLETDGCGGYASSTVPMCPTRRYHGLLVARPPGAGARHLFLSRFEEVLRVGGDAFALSTAQYRGARAPEGYRALQRFELDPFPKATYVAGGVELVREVLLVRGAPIVLVRWTADRPGADGRDGDGPAWELELRPFLACRAADALTFENDGLNEAWDALERGLVCRPYAALPPVSLTWSDGAAGFRGEPTWYRRFEYAEDLRRGYQGREDQWSPGRLRVPLAPGRSLVVAATIAEPVNDPAALWRVEAEVRREELAEGERDLAGRLALGADDFLYRDASGRPGVAAGYPWFGEWGRDTFVALPGLTLARRRVAECAGVLASAAPYVQGGLLPNVFGADASTSDYGSADAALWFARAVRLYEKAGGDRERVLAELYPVLRGMAEAYLAGTDPALLELGLSVDEAGCLVLGRPDRNATWMDARTGAGPVTPRDGCAVELNALWYYLLAYLEELASAALDSAAAKGWRDRRRVLRRAFLERFWLADEGYLADVWKDGQRDASVRPNMVIAAALELSPLTRAQRAGVVERAEAELLTPYGLRSLSPAHPAYVGRYAGGPEGRDRAYHQGTVWPWLLGFYVEAALRARGTRRSVRDALAARLAALEAELDRCGLGHVSEVFDGDPPHRPGGTIAQAWNTAELLRGLELLKRTRL